MEEDPKLPSLRHWSANLPISPGRPRKRVRVGSPVPSSDPPIFSSDDDPSVDNYSRDHQKKKYRGPWFQQQQAPEGSIHPRRRDSTQTGKRVFERQYDSGVFLGSDMDDTIDGFENVRLSTNLPSRPVLGSQTSLMQEPTPEERARAQIDQCIENGIETIDLSSQGLTSLSNDTIRPLGALTRVPPVTEGVFDRIEPRLQLFLASNSLTSLPEEIFNLSNITVLSLRSNKLHELPSAIGRMRSLVELNISQNGLQYLPYEVLELFAENSCLESFQIHPNLFHEPQFPPEDKKDEEERLRYKIGVRNRMRPRRGAIAGLPGNPRYWSPAWQILYRARTEVRYMDKNGAHCQGPTLSNHTLFGPRKFSNGIPVAGVDDVPTPPTSGGPLSRVPSLLEVAISACSKSPELPHLICKLPQDHPHYFPSLLSSAAAKKESGGSQCTICKRNFIIPRTEWIEWLEIAKYGENATMASAASPLRQMENERDAMEKMVPLIRRGCSWLCVPGKLGAKENKMKSKKK